MTIKTVQPSKGYPLSALHKDVPSTGSYKQTVENRVSEDHLAKILLPIMLISQGNTKKYIKFCTTITVSQVECRMQGCAVYLGISNVGRGESWHRLYSSNHFFIHRKKISRGGATPVVQTRQQACLRPEWATVQIPTVPVISTVRITQPNLRTCNCTTSAIGKLTHAVFLSSKV